MLLEILRSLFSVDDFSARQLDRLERIHQAYTRHIADSGSDYIPQQFRMQNDNAQRPSWQVTAEDIKSKVFELNLGNGHLRTIAEDCLASINLYLTLRIKNKAKKTTFLNFREGMLDYNIYGPDPEALFCEELKAWLVMSLSHCSLDSDALNNLIHRINYIKECTLLINESPGNICIEGKSLVSVLDQVVDRLEKDVLPQVELAMSRRSAREHFDQLVRESRSLVLHGFRYIFYLLRSESDVPEFSLADIRSPHLKAYKNAMFTTTGIITRCFLTTELMYYLFPDWYLEEQQRRTNSFLGNVKQNIDLATSRSVAGLIRSNPVYDESTYSWKRALQKSQAYSFGTELKLFPESDWFLKPRSGIYKELETQKVAELFLKMNQLLYDFGVLNIVCNRIYDLAGEGGNLLVYGAMARDISKFIESFGKLKQEFNECLELLHTEAVLVSRQKKQIKQKSKESKQRDGWKSNYLICNSFHKRTLCASLKKCSDLVGLVDGEIKRDLYIRFANINTNKVRVALDLNHIHNYSQNRQLGLATYVPELGDASAQMQILPHNTAHSFHRVVPTPATNELLDSVRAIAEQRILSSGGATRDAMIRELESRLDDFQCLQADDKFNNAGKDARDYLNYHLAKTYFQLDQFADAIQTLRDYKSEESGHIIEDSRHQMIIYHIMQLKASCYKSLKQFDNARKALKILENVAKKNLLLDKVTNKEERLHAANTFKNIALGLSLIHI